MVRLRTPTRPPSYVGNQRSDETPRFREAGYGYRPTLTSNVVTMSIASQCEGRYGSDFPTFCPYTGHHTTRRDLATTLLAKQRLPRCSPAWGHSRNQKAKNARGDATTLLASVVRWLRPNDQAFTSLRSMQLSMEFHHAISFDVNSDIHT
jgi:hypothetical protein